MKNRKIGIATKVLIIVMVLLVLSDLVMGIGMFCNMRSTIERRLKEEAKNLAACAASEIRQISEEVIQVVSDLANETKEMLAFTGSTAMSGYDHLKENHAYFLESTTRFGETIRQFSSLGNEISENVGLMKESTQQINETIENTADGLYHITEKSIQVTNDVKDIAGQVETSSNISDALYQEVHKFKVS